MTAIQFCEIVSRIEGTSKLKAKDISTKADSETAKGARVKVKLFEMA
jgi:hypothetical protein